MKKVMSCSKCIFPSSFPNIEFDENGLCNYCRNHKAITFKSEEKLKEILDSKKGVKYDVVVPLSGGKDSTYILYYAVKMFKLRVIAVNYDSGFQIPIAMENAENACKILNVPLTKVKANEKTQKSLMREILKISKLAGAFYNYCGNCETNIRTSALNTANKYNVPFVLYGHTQLEDPPVRPSFIGLKSFIYKTPKHRMPELLFHSAKYCYYSIKQRIEMKVPLAYRFKPKGRIPFPENGVRFINFFDYVKWDSINKIAFLEENLGWQHPKDIAHRFDCMIHCFANHRWYQESGITLDGIHYATMIREKHLEREDAMKNELVIRNGIMNDCRRTIEKIGIDNYEIPPISM